MTVNLLVCEEEIKVKVQLLPTVFFSVCFLHFVILISDQRFDNRFLFVIREFIHLFLTRICAQTWVLGQPVCQY